jgi:antitoxin MazE
MRSRIVRIGNSQGIRIPKPLLAQAGLEDEVELHAEDGRIVIATARRPRAGWADAARRLHDAGGDALESTGAPAFDHSEWEWR